ncbi:hypothetical protein [Sphingobacterium cavernae]|uniref:hypothetical protein n=1 Tax=Sphingobacterium cavernae TaxID=2592657 RepID=UPI00122FD04D|nr:hypothetical protein [Sphingobacterium cavernae]
MDNEQLNIDFHFNTPDAKRELSEISADVAEVNKEAEKGNKPLKEREGIIERLKRRIGELRDAQNQAISVSGIARYNSELQKYESELVRVNRAGREGFDSHGLALVSNEGILQRLQRAAALYQKGMYEATRPENLEKYSQKLALVNAEMSKLTNGAQNVGKSNWNGLQNSVNQIGRELPAITYGFQTFAMGVSNNLPILADEIGRIRKENTALAASGQKGVPVWKQLTGALFSWGTLLSVGITLLTVYGKEIGNFFSQLLAGKTTISQAKRDFESLNAVMSEASKTASKEIAQLKILSTVAADVTKSTKERKEATKQLQELGKSHNIQLKTEAILAGEAAAQYQLLAKSILEAARSKAAQSKIEENEAKRLDMEFKRVKILNANSNEKVRAAKEGDDIRTVSQGSLGTMTMVSATVAEKQRWSDNRAKEALKEIDSEMKVLDKTSEFLMKFVKVEAEGKKIKSKGPGENIFDRLSNSSKDLIDKISKLDAEYSRKVLSSDEEEMQVLREKFSDFRKLIEEENEKILAYNKKYKKDLATIDVNALAPVQTKAEANLTYTQNTNKLQKQFEEEYKLYEEYQRLVKETNEQYANERFSDSLDTIKSFEQRLNTELSKIDPKTTNVLEIKRREDLMKIVVDMQRKTQAEEDKLFVEALSKYADYHQKRAKIIEDAEKEITKLTKEGRLNEADNARKQRNDSLIELGKSEIEASEAYKTVINTIDKSSKAMMVNAFKTGKETVYSLVDGLKDATDSEKAKLKKLFGEFFDKGISAANLDKGDYINSLVDGFGELAVMATQFDSSLGNSLNTISSMINTVSQLSSAIGQFKNSDLLKGVGQSLGIFGAFTGVVGSVTSYFAQKQAEEQQKIYDQANHSTQLQLKATEAITHALQKQVELINEIYGAERLEKYNTTLKDIQGGWSKLNNELGTKYKLSGNKEIDDLIAKLNNGLSWEEITKKMKMDDLVKTYNRLNDIVKGKYGGKFSPITDDIKAAQQELIKLEQIANSGKADENTLNLINQLRNQIDLYNEVANKLREETTGNAFATILNNVKSLFKENGEDSAEAWAKSFDNIMENYILQKFSRDYLEKALQDWYAMLDAYAISGGSIDEAEKKALQDAYNKIQQDGQKRVDQIKDAMGFDPDESSSNTEKTQGRINRNISENTGSAILSFERSRYDLSKKHIAISEKALDFHVKSHDLMNAQLRHQAAIEQNTANTVSELKNAVVELKAINKNTSKTGRSAEGMGL